MAGMGMTWPLNHAHGIKVGKFTKALPRGYKARKAKAKWPFRGDEYVEFKVRTADGIGTSGAIRAQLFKLNWEQHGPSDEGGIVGYQILPPLPASADAAPAPSAEPAPPPQWDEDGKLVTGE
jgi:hypothetical protein